MNKISPVVTLSRRKLLLTIVAGAAGLISSAAFAKSLSVGGAASMAEQLQSKTSANLSNEHFVMYF